MINSLSGRLLILTVIFVMLAEVLIFLPSIANFREEYLRERLDRSHLASLVLLAADEEMLDPELERQMLANAGVLNIILRVDGIRRLVLAEPMPMTGAVEAFYNLEKASWLDLIRDALSTMMQPKDRMVRVIGKPRTGDVENPVKAPMEVTLLEAPLQQAMYDYARKIFALSLLISGITASLLFFVVRRILVKPIRGVVNNMIAYQDNPQDAARIIDPKAGVQELRAAETALHDLQSQLTRNLRQKERLASLGEAVSKISHDLRNMLTTVQLLADRMETSEDPAVKRIAPKLIGSVNRAINLAEQTLEFGKVEEAAPNRKSIKLVDIVQDIKDAESLREDAVGIEIEADFSTDFAINADAEQMFRAMNNLVRNARQAIASSGSSGVITVRALTTDSGCQIEISDTGPGLPLKARENLFTPFYGGTRRGGSGLGLAIAAELVRGHGGSLELVDTSDFGTRFRITLPDVAEGEK